MYLFIYVIGSHSLSCTSEKRNCFEIFTEIFGENFEIVPYSYFHDNFWQRSLIFNLNSSTSVFKLPYRGSPLKNLNSSFSKFRPNFIDIQYFGSFVQFQYIQLRCIINIKHNIKRNKVPGLIPVHRHQHHRPIISRANHPVVEISDHCESFLYQGPSALRC